MPRLFYKNEIIYSEDEEVEELYLIKNGVVSIDPGKFKDIIHYKTNFFPGNKLGVYYCLYNVNS